MVCGVERPDPHSAWCPSLGFGPRCIEVGGPCLGGSLNSVPDGLDCKSELCLVTGDVSKTLWGPGSAPSVAPQVVRPPETRPFTLSLAWPCLQPGCLFGQLPGLGASAQSPGPVLLCLPSRRCRDYDLGRRPACLAGWDGAKRKACWLRGALGKVGGSFDSSATTS